MSAPDYFDMVLGPSVIGKEGGYTNNKSDAGGETMWGITSDTAKRYGYLGPMNMMPKSAALGIYKRRYWIEPQFDMIADINPAIAGEMFDTGVNLGLLVSGSFLQTALNAFNRQAADYADILVDGDCGPTTRRALQAYLDKRGQNGVSVMLKALNCLQGAKYLALASRPANEDFEFGWIANRISI